MESKNRFVSLFTLAIATLASTPAVCAQAQDGTHLATSQQRQIERSSLGAIVRDEDGNPVSYTREELLQFAPADAVDQPSLLAALDQTSAPEASPDVKSNTTELSLRPVWGYAAFGEGIGVGGIAVSGTGEATEIYVAASTSSYGAGDYWYALRYDPESASYEQVFVSSYIPEGIAHIELAKIASRPQPVILVGLEDGRLQLYARDSKVQFREIETLADDLTGLAVADLDRDGYDEVVVSTATHLFWYELNGKLLGQMSNVGGSNIAVAQMDFDSGLEIATSDGNVIDVDRSRVQWNQPGGFGNLLKAADINGDGIAELIAAQKWNFVSAFDIARGHTKWTVVVDYDVGAIEVTDIDGDSVKELLVGEGQWGSILAFDTQTQALEWSIDNPEHGVTNIAVADTNNDGTKEVLWGAGASSSGPDRLYVADWTTRAIEWENLQLDGPFLGPELGDLDGDGVAEMVVASFESEAGYGSGRIMVFDTETLKLRAVSEEVSEGGSWTGLKDLKLRDLNADGRMEILVAADYYYDGVIEAYSFASDNTFSLHWTNTSRPDGASFYTVDAADIDGDGQMEIIGGAESGYGSYAGTFVYIYDYVTATEEGRSPVLGTDGGAITSLAIEDLNADGTLEIIAAAKTGNAYVIDGSSKALTHTIVGEFTDFSILKSASSPTILLADAAGDLSMHRQRFRSYSEIYRENFVPEEIDGFTLDESVGGPWIGSNGVLQLVQPTGTVAQSAAYGEVFGQRTRLLPSAPLLMTTGSYSVMGLVPYPTP